MRIAHVITRMIVGGAQENTLLNCLDLIREHGDEVLLISGPSLGPEGDLLSQGRAGELPVSVLPDLRRAIHPLRDWRASGQLRDAIRSFGPEVVHTHSAKGGLLGRRVAHSLRVPAIIHTVHGAPFHDYQSAWARELFRRCERHAASRCHAMISVADAMTDLMVDAGVAPREKFTTIYSGMDVEPFLQASRHREEVRGRFGIDPDAVVFGKIARLFHLKGHDDLIAAAAEVVDQVPHAHFMLVGDGLLRDSLTADIRRRGLQRHFTFTGLVPPSDVAAMIGAMDVLVHTSLREGLARALPQALIAGLPVVSFDIDGAREVTLDGTTGFLVRPRDVSGLVAAMTTLAGDKSLRQRMGHEGRRRFTEPFRHQTMTQRIRDLYRQVLENRGANGRGFASKVPVGD